MPSDPVLRLLTEDFATERNDIERDGFSERILHVLAQKRRARLAVIGGVGAIGAGLAGAQFMKIEDLLAPVSPLITDLAGYDSLAGISTSLTPQILAAAAIAAAFAATAFVLQTEQ